MKDFADAFIARLQLGQQCRSGMKTEAAREALALLGIFRNGMRLPFRLYLQTMFNAPQKTIRLIESAHFWGGQQFKLGDSAQCLQCSLLLQKSVFRAVNELERLDNKLDLTNSAGAEFDVQFIRRHFALNPTFDGGNFVEQLRRGILRKNERLMLPRKFVGQLFTSANVARFDQREALPGFAEPSIIIFHAFERAGERAGRTLGTQSQIEPEQNRLARRKGFYESFREAVVPFVIGQSR